MKLLALTLSSVFLLTGCSALAGADGEADGKACQELVSLTSTENLNLELLDTANLANQIRSSAVPVAGADFGGKIDQLASALESDPIETATLTTAAAEVALRCAVVGVSFDFSSISQVLGKP